MAHLTQAPDRIKPRVSLIIFKKSGHLAGFSSRVSGATPTPKTISAARQGRAADRYRFE
jgi:hypothetical protein